METIHLAEIAELGTRTLTSSAEAIAAVGELVHRVTGVDITVVSEVTADGRYVFRSIEARPYLPVGRDDAIPWEQSLCSRGHAGESPPTVPDTRRVPALWESWQRLREQHGVDWDVLAFCTRDIRLPDGTFFGTLCIHHRETRVFSADEQGLLDVLARLLAQEVWRERAAARLGDALSELELAQRRRIELAEELRHELLAPLQVIDGYAEAMLDDVVSRDDEHVVLVRREAGRAMRLLDDLVDLVRLEARADDAELGPVDAGSVMEEMRARLAPLAEAAGVELEARTETERPPRPETARAAHRERRAQRAARHPARRRIENRVVRAAGRRDGRDRDRGRRPWHAGKRDRPRVRAVLPRRFSTRRGRRERARADRRAPHHRGGRRRRRDRARRSARAAPDRPAARRRGRRGR